MELRFVQTEIYPPDQSALQMRACGWEECSSGHSFGPAARDYYLLHVIEDGEGEYFLEDRHYKLGKNQAFLIFPGDVTFYRADEKNPWKYRWIGYSGIAAADYTRQAGISRENPIVNLGDVAEKILQTITNTYDDAHTLNRATLAALGRLYRLFALIAQAQQPELASTKSVYFERARWYMQANLQRSIRVEDIADYVGLSRSQLFRVFKEAVGLSPQMMLINMKLECAEGLLAATELTLSEVALSSGFSSAARMGDVFRKYRDVTPLQIRKRRNQDQNPCC